jgi:hypothetical protein
MTDEDHSCREMGGVGEEEGRKSAASWRAAYAAWDVPLAVWGLIVVGG